MARSTVTIREVDDYDPDVRRDLMHRNLDTTQVTVQAKNYRRAGDPSHQPGRIIRLGAFDGDALVGLSWGQSMTATRFPSSASAAPMDAVAVVFPTPPFPDVITMILPSNSHLT